MTMRETVLVRWGRVLFLTLAFLFVAAVTRAATITIVNLDGPGEGFNDPTPVAPVGGNPDRHPAVVRLSVRRQHLGWHSDERRAGHLQLQFRSPDMRRLRSRSRSDQRGIIPSQLRRR